MFKQLYTYKSNYLFLLLILLVSIPLSLDGSVVLSTVSACICGALFAVLLLSDMNKALLGFVPCVSALTVFLLTFDGFAATLSLSFLPVGFAIAYSVVKIKSMSQAVTYSAVALIAWFVFIYISHIIYLFGAFTADTVKEYVNAFLTKVSVMLQDANSKMMTADGNRLFSDEYISTMFLTFKYSFVGLYLSGMMIASFASNILFKKAISKIDSDSEELKNAKERKFVMSKQAGIMYILLYVIIFFGGTSERYMMFAIQTMIYPIKLGLVYTGIFVLFNSIKERRISIFSLAIILVVFYLLYGSLEGVLISLVTVFGLISVLRKKRF